MSARRIASRCDCFVCNQSKQCDAGYNHGGAALVQALFNPDGSRQRDNRQSASTAYSWDPVGRISQWQLLQSPAGAPNTETSRWNFAYTPASQITSVARTNDSFAWTGRVNVNRAYAPNGLNQYGAVSGTAYCYDANGNLTADGTSVYRYDMENRLVEKRSQQSSTCPTATSGYGGALVASSQQETDEMIKQSEEFKQEAVRSIIIEHRGNPTAYLGSAVCSQLVDVHVGCSHR